MTTIAEIQASLLDTSMRGDFSTMTTILNGLTLEQKSQITVFGTVLENVANNWSDPQGVAVAVRTVMSTVGPYTQPISIGHALMHLSQSGNFAAVDGITDSLTNDFMKSNIPADLLGMVLNNLSMAVNDPVATATAVRDFSSKLLAFVDPGYIGFSLLHLSQSGNFAAVDGITDSLTNDFMKSNIPADLLGRALNNLSMAVNDPVATATAVRDFSSKLLAFVDPGYIGFSLLHLSQSGNFAAVDGITDSLTNDFMKSNIPADLLGMVLNNLSMAVNDPVATATAVRDFSSKLLAFVDPGYIGFSLLHLSQSGNFAAVDGITDSLTNDFMKSNIPADLLGMVLNNLSMAVNDPVATATAVRDFSSKLLAFVDPGHIGISLTHLSESGNFAAVDGITDSLTNDFMKSNIPADLLGRTLVNLTEHVINSGASDQVVVDFSKSVGAFIPTADAYVALLRLAENGLLETESELLDYLSDYSVGSMSQVMTHKFLTSAADTFAGTASADIVFGRAGNDVLNGAAGNDQLYGGLGNDTLNGGTGSDVMVGGAGNDTYYVDSTSDLVVERAGEGVDTVISSVGFAGNTEALMNTLENITLTGTAGIGANGTALANVINGNAGSNGLIGLDGADTINGGDGNDFIWGGNGILSNIAAVSDNDTLNGGNGDDTIYGEAGNDVLKGDAGNDTLDGGVGNDVLNGGAGTDVMKGGTGNDTYYVDSASDLVVEVAGGGVDTVISSIGFAGNTEALMNALENITLTGTADIGANGTALANVINGNAGSNGLIGLSGADTINGGDGNDFIWGGNGVLSPMAAVSDNDILRGGNGNDTIYGEAGNDSILGGHGSDTLTGGAGYDAFVFARDNFSGTVNATNVRAYLASAGVDRITDFTLGQDKISAGADVAGLTTYNATSVYFTQSGTSALLQVDVDGAGSVAPVTIATLDSQSAATLNANWSTVFA